MSAPRHRFLSSTFIAIAALALTACSPAQIGDGGGANTFEWYANGCVTAADTARSLYASADSPLSRTVAEKALDALEIAGARVVEALPADNSARAELLAALAKLDARIPITDISSDEQAKFERNKAVVDEAISEVGQMCKSIFTGFDATLSPSPQT